MLCSALRTDFILVYDLKDVVVDVFLVNKRNVLRSAVVAFEDLDIVLLNTACLFNNSVVCNSYGILEKPVPLRVRKPVIVERLKSVTKIGYKILLIVYWEILISLLSEIF